MSERIPGGSFLVARKIFDSEIWLKPPIYQRTWLWILGHANHSDYQKNGRIFKRGEVITTYNKLIQAMLYYNNHKAITPTIKQVRIILKWLESQGMIIVEPLRVQRLTRADPGADPIVGTRAYVGIKIVVVNYSTYQDLESYKGRPKKVNKDRGLSQLGHNNKNVQECNIKTSSFDNDNRVPFEEIKEVYHKMLPDLPRVKKFTAKRKSMIKARWSEDKNRQSLKWWEGYFVYVSKSDFLMGRQTKFKANFEWLIGSSNLIKVTEGNYHE